MKEHRRIKGKILSPTWPSLSVWIKFLQLPPLAFMDTVSLVILLSMLGRLVKMHRMGIEGMQIHKTHSYSMCFSFRLPFF